MNVDNWPLVTYVSMHGSAVGIAKVWMYYRAAGGQGEWVPAWQHQESKGKEDNIHREHVADQNSIGPLFWEGSALTPPSQ